MYFFMKRIRPRKQSAWLVVFHNSLTWEAHVSELSHRCMGLLISLSHVSHYLPDGVIKTIVTALVISQVNNCLSIYGNGTKRNLSQLQKILNFATGRHH